MRKTYTPSYADKASIERGDWHRASSECQCQDCKLEFWRHRRVAGFEWLTRLCNGSFVKL